MVSEFLSQNKIKRQSRSDLSELCLSFRSRNSLTKGMNQALGDHSFFFHFQSAPKRNDCWVPALQKRRKIFIIFVNLSEVRINEKLVIIDILRILDYLNQLMYNSSILAAMSACCTTAGWPVHCWGLLRAGRMRRASILTVLDGRPGGLGQFW